MLHSCVLICALRNRESPLVVWPQHSFKTPLPWVISQTLLLSLSLHPEGGAGDETSVYSLLWATMPTTALIWLLLLVQLIWNSFHPAVFITTCWRDEVTSRKDETVHDDPCHQRSVGVPISQSLTEGRDWTSNVGVVSDVTSTRRGIAPRYSIVAGQIRPGRIINMKILLLSWNFLIRNFCVGVHRW